MATHKAMQTIHTSPTVDSKDREALAVRRESGIPEDQARVLTPGEHFTPSEVHMTDADVKRLEQRGVIQRLEGARQSDDLHVGTGDGDIPGTDALGAAQRAPKDPDNPNVSENRTPGSGATGQGTRQSAPPGINAPGSQPDPTQTKPLQPAPPAGQPRR